LIHKYADVFTPKSEGKVGVTDLLELELKLAPGPVIRQKPRPLNPTMKESLDQQIADWLQQGVNGEAYDQPTKEVGKCIYLLSTSRAAKFSNLLLPEDFRSVFLF
jgi:hypothetical protein